MAERTDHAALAEVLLGQSQSQMWDVDTAPEVQLYIQQAQVHATLALAEQQRIANLIALSQWRMLRSDLPRWRSVLLDMQSSDITLSPDVAAALGLSGD